MARQYLVAFASFWLGLASTRVLACGAHMYIDPNNLGFFGGAVVRMAGLAPPEPVFELEFPSMAKAVIGEESEVVVNYSRPFFSKNVRLELKGTSNVQLHLKEILLEERKGSVTIPYQLTGTGFDQITLTVSGEHKGENVRESGRIYLRASGEPPKQELQVSER